MKMTFEILVRNYLPGKKEKKESFSLNDISMFSTMPPGLRV